MRKIGRRDLDKLIRIEKWIDDLNKLTDVIVIVEGKTDKLMLKKIGINHKIIIFYEKDFWKKVHLESRLKKKMIILTDFDEEGKNLNKKIIRYVLDFNIKVLDKERTDFRIVTKGFGNEIYEIVKRILELKEKYI